MLFISVGIKILKSSVIETVLKLSKITLFHNDYYKDFINEGVLKIKRSAVAARKLPTTKINYPQLHPIY
ncbi:hypothetical protein BED47_12310 [Gottfriedia luciferensis]|uniref:Uncharacterized protein n=1 Tax=Gottfriedia luciferensis TaxID=178774 RepID=A0ABX2ZNM4_9BACI|nr:hypothetical protein BED47_12310 [Gottfriedia luciferensis]